MKKLIFLVFFSFLFATCNKSSINSAYKDYYKYQQQYISALLDDNRQKEITALTDLIDCGKFLKFNTKDYEQKLKQLKNSKKFYKTKINIKPKPDTTPSKRVKKISKYIKIYSYNPLKLRIPDKNIKVFTIKTKKLYKKIIDIHNAIISKPVFKKFKTHHLKIAQYNKKTVRIVLYNKKRLSIKYFIKNNILTIQLSNNKKPIIKNVLSEKIENKTLLQNNTFKINPKNKIIVIDPGHGGKDSGGIGLHHRMEKVAVLQIAKYVKYYLEKYGYKVYLTRSGDYFITLKNRTHFANVKKADLFISIHCNIAPTHVYGPHGIETYFLSPTRSKRAIRVAKIENKEVKGLNYLDQSVILKFLNKDRIIESNKLGIDVQAGMLSSLRSKFSNVKDGGVRPAPFWVLVGTQMPAILIETGFLTNPLESKRLFNPAYQKLLAKGIAIGVVNYFRKNP